jgi:hypothetical protein
MQQFNEITDRDKLLSYLNPADWDNFCTAWYNGLDLYKEYPNSLILMANAVLTHWEVPLYVVDVSWDSALDCFVWHFGKNDSPDYP